MINEVPQVEEVVRFGLWRTVPVTFEDKVFTEDNFLVADSNFFQFFSFPVVNGDPATALKGTDKIAITESAAKRYFGDDNPIGKIILRGSDKKATEVTALAITKLDGTAKGGVVIGISDEFKIPVKYIGVGEKVDDLQVFNKAEFVDSLFKK